MRIIIEEHKYAAADVKEVLKGIDALENVEGYVSVNYVGYFYNTDKAVRDCVFILPKVLLEERVGGQVPDSLLSWNCRRSAISGCQCVPFGVLAKVMRNDE